MRTNMNRRKDDKIIIPGGAGQVGQNLVFDLLSAGYKNIVVIDKHAYNLEILKKLFPSVTTVLADLSVKGDWIETFDDATCVVMLQAQIGGLKYVEFERNTLDTTSNILDVMEQVGRPQLVHVSSSVVASKIDNFYNKSKAAQEKIIRDRDYSCIVLRPTLMFGWFDRKHLGWVSRFMKKSPIFPIPGNGKYIRRPLYVRDFTKIIISCIEGKQTVGEHDIFGTESVYYIDMMRVIRNATNAKTIIVKVPYSVIDFALGLWACFDHNPPFTRQQLRYLVAEYDYDVKDWQSIFGVKSTPYDVAINDTYNNESYSCINLKF